MSERTEILDGKIFIGEFGKKGGAAEGTDRLIFREGRFNSISCVPYAFGDAPYSVVIDGDIMTFAAETFSMCGGKIKWRGMIKDGTLDGTFIWHRLGKWLRVNKAPTEYWFKGQSV